NGTRLKPGLSDNDLREIEAIEHVAGVAPSVKSTVSAKRGNEWAEKVSLEGRNDTYFRETKDVIARGRGLNRLDMESLTRVCVINEEMAESLFFGVDPLGEEVIVGGHTFTVVGILSSDSDMDVMAQMMGLGGEKVVIPYTTAMRILHSSYITSLDVYVADTDYTDQVIDDLEDTLYAAFNYHDDTYSVINMESLLDTMNTMMSLMTGLLAGIASIALLVGGIGIMNMMLVSVTERTTEIGLRKALGAEPGQIQLQFLIESFILSMLGGVIGMVLGVLVSFIFAVAADITFRISWSAIALGVGFSATVGIVFGWTPARKASLLNPIDALRSM
ncbi:MAG: ABC transporter permease, partial [Clostridia bacterium]|nr:ABC transporter permease [Clostridia bacterium]